MIIEKKEIDVDDLLDKKYMHKKINDKLYLNDYQIDILNYYKIDYNACTTAKDLLFLIDRILEEEDGLEDLDAISKEISEFDYYHNTNK